VDIYEAGQRIFRRHWALILLFVLIGLSVPLVLDRLQATDYQGTARLDLGIETHSGQASSSLADGALGFVTSPDVLGAALKTAKVQRDVQEMITNQDIRVTPVGTSGILDISVTDPSARASAAIANSLATQLVQTRDQATYGAMQQLLASLQKRSGDLSRQIAAVVDQAKQSFYVRPGLQQQQADLAAQRNTVDQQIQSLSQTLATAQHPRLLDVSQKAGVPLTRNLSTLLALGALLGLFVGVAVAATREAMRPTLDRTALTRHLGVPLLGRLPRRRQGATALDPWLAGYVGAAADTAGVQAVQLIPVGKRPADVTDLARALDEAVDGVRVSALQLPGRRRRHAQGTAQPLSGGADVGVVVVSPEVTKGKHLAGLEQHLQVTRQPVIGVITYRGRLAPIAQPAHGDLEAELRSEVGQPETARHGIPSTASTPAS
jgi:capsular polysaccharide biosynthesis protein